MADNHKYLNEERTQELIDDIKEKMSSGGHIIQNASGMEMASRQGLQFKGRVGVSDDSANNRTLIEVIDIYGDGIIAPQELTNVATRSYAEDDQLIYNNKLFTVLEAIAVDDDLISDDDFVDKTWNGLTSFKGSCVWTDGENIYYSYTSQQYVLDKSTSTWSAKTWNGLTSFGGLDIWTDGENIYYSKNSDQYVLDKSTSTWSPKTWNGLTSFKGSCVWTDGENIYYSKGSDQYVLDKSTSTWSAKSWNGLTSFDADFYIWTDGENIYYSYTSQQYVLDKSTSTWSPKTWNGIAYNFTASNIWTDGENIYESDSQKQKVLDKSTSTWYDKTWRSKKPSDAYNLWTDGDNIYQSLMTIQRVLKKGNIKESDPLVEQLSKGGGGGGGVMEVDTVTITTSDWEASVTYSDYPYKYTVSVTGMTADYFVDAELVSGTFEDSWAVASESGMLAFYVESLPTESLTFKYWYMKGE